MKKLMLALALLAFLFASPVYAEPDPICVTAVFHDRNGVPPLGDLVVISVTTNAIPSLKAHRGRPLLAIFIVRGDPGSRGKTVFTGHEEFAVSKSGEDDVYVAQHDKSPGQILGQQFTLGKNGSFLAVTVPDASAHSVVIETDSTVLIELDPTDPLYDDAQLRASLLSLENVDICNPS